jgi:hypothetical protein
MAPQTERRLTKREKMQSISTAKQAIDALGGPKAVATWLGTSPDAVLMMRHRGNIARGYHLHFWVTLKSMGLAIEPSLFGLDTFDELLMPQLRMRKGRNTRGLARVA